MSWGPVRPAADPPGPMANVPTAAVPAAALLQGLGLPGRWAGRQHFVVLDNDFGLGEQFLATWAAWRQDPLRCERLVYLAICPQAPLAAQVARAHSGGGHADLARALASHWPAPTPDMHCLDLDAGSVRLLLASGEPARVMPEWVASVDAFCLAVGATDERLLRGLHRLAAPAASLVAHGDADRMHHGLQAAGFALTETPATPGQPALTRGRFAPRVNAVAPPGRWPLPAAGRQTSQALPPQRPLPPLPPSPRLQVAVIGAGLAGAATARALAAQGVGVQVFDRQAGPAAETSGNAGGLFHGIVHGHDSLHARWLRAAALHTERVLRPLIEAGTVPGAIQGLLRGEHHLTSEAMAALLQRQGLPASFVQICALALPGGRPAWRYPGGGWVAPADLCAHWLSHPLIRTHFGATVQQLQPEAERWQLRLSGASPKADAAAPAPVDAVVLCNAADASRLAGDVGWPLQTLRGQTTLLPPGWPGLPALPQPVADAGYALRLHTGQVLCGGSSQAGDTDPLVREADHRDHLAILRRLADAAGCPHAATATAEDARADLRADTAPDLTGVQGRVGWRLQTPDRLPLLGGVPDLAALAGLGRRDQPRLLPRVPGLYVFTALGSRGITQAALGGEILAALLLGLPVPAPASILDALDPARFIARDHRAGRA